MTRNEALDIANELLVREHSLHDFPRLDGHRLVVLAPDLDVVGCGAVGSVFDVYHGASSTGSVVDLSRALARCICCKIFASTRLKGHHLLAVSSALISALEYFVVSVWSAPNEAPQPCGASEGFELFPLLIRHPYLSWL